MRTVLAPLILVIVKSSSSCRCTHKGEAYEKFYEKAFGRPATGQPNAGIAAEIKAIQEGLQNPQFAPIEAEYQRTKKARKGRVPAWYSLFGGPQNLAGGRDLVSERRIMSPRDRLEEALS